MANNFSYSSNGNSLKNKKGAALLAVLIVAVVMVILMSVASSLLDSRLILAQDSKQYFTEQAKVYAKRSELIYLLATQHKTVAGVSQGTLPLNAMLNDEGFLGISPLGDELRVDGYLYSGEGGVSFSIQNESGLVPINDSNQYWLKALLKAHGYGNSEQTQLTDSLADYADADDLRRAAGAEKNGYGQDAFIYAPRNFLMQSCTELWRVANWGSLPISIPSFVKYCSLRRNARLNVNALPITLWQILFPSTVDDIVDLRANNRWFLSHSDILAVDPSLISLPENYYTYLGGSSFKLDIESEHVWLNFRVEIGQRNALPIKVKH